MSRFADRPTILSLLTILSLATGCASVSPAPPDARELRLPGLPWGLSTPEVVAALVQRGFRFAGRNPAGDLRFAGGELLGHEASLVARMDRDRLVKIVALLEPRRPGLAEREIESLSRRLRRFYGPEAKVDLGSREPGPGSRDPDAGSLAAGEESGPARAWLRRRPDGRRFGVLLRTTPARVHRLDLESPEWPDVHDSRRTRQARRLPQIRSET